MRRLLICSIPDVASVNIRDSLMSLKKWEDIGSDGRNSYHANGDDVIMTIPGLHISTESPDAEAEAFGIKADEVIFMSKHKAASAIPTLTVHPIGNHGNADFGGRPKELVKASPASMTEALRKMNERGLDGFEISFEVTHHGPWSDRPTFFIEIGSDESMWGNMDAARLLAETIAVEGENDHPTAVGIGGGHYAPRFTEIATRFKLNFGHMVPNYALTGSDDDIGTITRAASASGTKLIYIHRKSMKGSERSRLEDMISSEGFEIISSKDLDPISS